MRIIKIYSEKNVENVNFYEKYPEEYDILTLIWAWFYMDHTLVAVGGIITELAFYCLTVADDGIARKLWYYQ